MPTVTESKARQPSKRSGGFAGSSEKLRNGRNPWRAATPRRVKVLNHRKMGTDTRSTVEQTAEVPAVSAKRLVKDKSGGSW